MNICLNKDQTRRVLQNMKNFENSLFKTFDEWGYNLRSNTGRRNALISTAQEKEVAKVLSETYKSVAWDGAPGQPDIVIEDLNKEIECKLTSGHGKSRTFDFQTDWETLQRKKELDYLYILCNKEFDNFCVLYFSGLTPDDFFPPANGSRGKSRMNKKKAMKKATCLFGDFDTLNRINIEKYSLRIKKQVKDKESCLSRLYEKYVKTERDVLAREKILSLKERESAKFDREITRLKEKIKLWEQKTPSFKFILSEI